MTDVRSPVPPSVGRSPDRDPASSPAPEPSDRRCLLNLGSGPHTAAGWIAIDASWNAWLAQHPLLRGILRRIGVIPDHHQAVGWPRHGILVHDVRRGLPMATGTVDGIFTAHFLEHLTREEGQDLLAECHRVLKPAGILRVIVPCLDALTTAYRTEREHGDPAAADRFLERLNLVGSRPVDPHTGTGWSGRVIRRLSRAGHRHMYDGPALVQALERAGFERVRQAGPGDSDLPEVPQVERPDHHVRSVAVEALKAPAGGSPGSSPDEILQGDATV